MTSPVRRPRAVFTARRLPGVRAMAAAALVATVLAACGSAISAPASPSTTAPAAVAASPSSLDTATRAASGAPTSAAAVAAATSAPATPAPAPTAAPAFPVTLTDDEGTAVALPARPERIVSLTPAVTESLFALGAGDRVVANTDFDDYPPQVKSLPHVASYTGVDVEKVVGMKPDLVIAGGNGFNPPEAIAKLRSVGIPVLVLYADSVDGILRDIELTGAAAGEAPAADALTAWMRGRIDAISAAARAARAPRVFYELDATKDIYGPAPRSFLASMIQLAGGDPVTTGDPAVFAIPLEKLVAADPQVIVLGDAAYGTTPAIVADRPGWGGMAAVKAGAVRPVDDTIVSRPGPRIVDGLRALALAIAPTVVLPEVGSPPPPPAP